MQPAKQIFNFKGFSTTIFPLIKKKYCHSGLQRLGISLNILIWSGIIIFSFTLVYHFSDSLMLLLRCGY